MPDPDTPYVDESVDETLPIDGDLLPPPVERPSFQEELEFLAAADPYGKPA